MKRIKYIVALVAMVGIFSAQAAEVDSVNMVGFAKVNLGQGLNIIGVPFVTVGDTETSLDDLFDVSEFTAGSSAGDSDVVTVWNGSGYDGYFLCNWTGPSYDEIAWSPVAAAGTVAAASDGIPHCGGRRARQRIEQGTGRVIRPHTRAAG